MEPIPDTLGLIAGSRSLPRTVARLAREAGARRLIAVGFQGETDPALSECVDELAWVKVGQLGKMIKALRSAGVAHCVMAGQISPKRLFDLRPDLRALAVLLRLQERNARTIFSAIANELQKDGIDLLDARPWLKPIIPGSGYAVGPKLSTSQREDLALGYRIAKEVSRLEIGQTVVVKGGAVLAVEGFEGTDACLQRGGELAGRNGGAVAVKVASETHDFRFDIPCIGAQTLDGCLRARIAVLAFESERTLLLDRAEIEARASGAGLTLTTVG
ncbi:MAG: UDP-2,3-diacylglucosamine diphosphatase LpxI [Verrucomicrobiota bacterium]